MKPSQFNYYSPNNLRDALKDLNDNEGAMVLSGGQSLVPAMNFRLANPSHIVDIKNINNLSSIEFDDLGCSVGALVTHRDFEINETVKKINPLIYAAMQYVAHIPIRNHGTVIGSLCHADAAAEMPLILLILEGKLVAESVDGKREINAKDFFKFHMTTSKADNEIITHAYFPNLPKLAGYSFSEFARRHGDYAIAGACAVIECDQDNKIKLVRLGGCGINNTPIRFQKAENLLLNNDLNSEILKEVIDVSMEYVTAGDDMHATLKYRKHLLSGLLEKVIKEAHELAIHKVKYYEEN